MSAAGDRNDAHLRVLAPNQQNGVKTMGFGHDDVSNDEIGALLTAGLDTR
jgi:hypothetical protein